MGGELAVLIFFGSLVNAHGGFAARGDENGVEKGGTVASGEGLGFSDGAKRWDRHPVSALTG
jgi:hypothetical protein